MAISLVSDGCKWEYMRDIPSHFQLLIYYQAVENGKFEFIEIHFKTSLARVSF